jgi:hypothetical protein
MKKYIFECPTTGDRVVLFMQRDCEMSIGGTSLFEAVASGYVLIKSEVL